MPTERICLHCGDPFTSRYPLSCHCSPACAYAAANRRRIEKVKVLERKVKQARKEVHADA